MAATVAASDFHPFVSPAAAAVLFQEGDAAHARCKKVVPPTWAAALKLERELCSRVKPVIERHLQRSPNAWRAAVEQEAQGQRKRRVERAQARYPPEGQPRCDGRGALVPELKWCACRLKRYCSKDCQRRDFPAHKAECKKARGIA